MLGRCAPQCIRWPQTEREATRITLRHIRRDTFWPRSSINKSRRGAPVDHAPVLRAVLCGTPDAPAGPKLGGSRPTGTTRHQLLTGHAPQALRGSHETWSWRGVSSLVGGAICAFLRDGWSYAYAAIHRRIHRGSGRAEDHEHPHGSFEGAWANTDYLYGNVG